MRNQTFEGVAIFKTLSFSKVIHFALVANIPKKLYHLKENQDRFLWEKRKLKNETKIGNSETKQKTLCKII